MTILELSPENVEANQLGHITRQQREKLESRAVLTIIVLAIILVMCPFVVTFNINEIIYHSQNPNSLINYALSIIVAVIFLVYSALLIRSLYRIRLDLQTNQIQSTVGKIQLRVKTGRGTSRKLVINSLEFDISRQLYKCFIDGENYRIYYAPHSVILLSAEQL